MLNVTKGKEIRIEVRFADNFIKRFLGLMFRKPRYVLIFVLPLETRINASVHGLFMREAIDVIFLNSNKEVVDLTVLKPWRFYVPKRPAKYIVEGPRGIIEALSVEVGDRLEWNRMI
ncbi:hypothetical protein PFDSM3638_05275 [Pyrococcus furiosus DSM 3638]|uniref:UPF0127 protein PF1050 n=3 Tax=Pyrococcus furiosus TaxID=2261 RepID=Y1050_PYRFU|nr:MULTISPECIES: DUF192 domain-containing protein [Pyrococcus]Q8U203.1 RecName: Full=UPF0127 protein PF1050 [Pyrococcus furiosus DSM 3638]AAL81174.1 hypothetical protein PF1050 [Pyrococcus furiosus DSM 3638]AFN03846.1 hypothetical protein PFC_04485 [Pyrococcus furiosus COM1]MDK2868825.1 uncharacterized protein [Pyrococcus sp.]QEK78711.1 hypothetical protein PFDSM3638_05275 [Pyrococcus furiosus DSM 3638]